MITTCKTWNSAFSREVLRIALCRSHRVNLRNHIWDKLATDIEYKRRGKVPKDLSEIIRMDVNRCFHHNPLINKAALTEMLMCYASYDTEIGYCQGMNYLVGNLFIFLQDESKAFQCFVTLSE